MSAVIAIVLCTYLAGGLAAFGAITARNAGEIPIRTMFFIASFSWLAFGYVACGGRLEPEAPPSASETSIKLSGSLGERSAPWDA